LELDQVDIKTVFLHGDLDEEIFMSKPKGFCIKREYGVQVKKIALWVKTITKAMIQAF